jgi:hypothetical protein
VGEETVPTVEKERVSETGPSRDAMTDLAATGAAGGHRRRARRRRTSAVIRARALSESFISEISLSTSSMNWMIKSTSLCLSIVSAWALVMRNEMS